jgi:hypothetical protein
MFGKKNVTYWAIGKMKFVAVRKKKSILSYLKVLFFENGIF